MHNTIKLTEDLYWVGANNRRLSLFENVYPIPKGVSYNSYVLLDEKTVLLDTIDQFVAEQFFENLEFALNGRKLDYLIVNHMEPDHCSQIKAITEKYKGVKIVCNPKTKKLIEQFFDLKVAESDFMIVKEGDVLNTGKHNLTFVFAPMVHWPEVMVTYDTTDKILFSADAFGTFGAIDGNIFADETDFDHRYMDEARRYYTNIVGKYGTQVQAILKKASTLEINMICPLHGFVWRKNVSQFIDKYINWSTYTPEEKGVLIVYGSIYGNTKNAAEILSVKLAQKGIRNIRMFDVSVTHPSYIIAEAFRVSHIVFAAPTYNAGVFVAMDNLIRNIVAHNLQNRIISVIENGSWGVTSGKIIEEELLKLKNTEILGQKITINSSLKDNQNDDLEALANEIFKSIHKDEVISEAPAKIDRNALFSISYGLYVLSSKFENKDNACIINTAMQVTDSPKQIAIAVNKANYTHEIILKSGMFNLSILTTETPFSVFENFGFHSGRDTEKFENFDNKERQSNGIYCLTDYTNAVICAKVVNKIDCGTHYLFIGEVTEAHKLCDVPSVTYDYYLNHIKPNPNNKLEEKKKGWICKICGYVYEGDVLPSDYICPLCKHGVEDFEKIG